MKTSQLIEQLQKNQAEHGDLDIDLMQDESDEAGEFCGIATMMGTDDKPVRVTLCGPETLEAFAS